MRNEAQEVEGRRQPLVRVGESAEAGTTTSSLHVAGSSLRFCKDMTMRYMFQHAKSDPAVQI